MEFDQPLPGKRLRISGRVRIADIPDMRAPLLASVDLGTGDLELDVAGVVVTDLAVLGLLLELHRRAGRRGRRLLLDNVPGDLDRLLRRSGVDRILNRARPATVSQVCEPSAGRLGGRPFSAPASVDLTSGRESVGRPPAPRSPVKNLAAADDRRLRPT